MDDKGKITAKIIGNLLRESGYTISVAESCTGGLVCDLVTSIPGSSDYFLGGVIAYSNRLKKELLYISGETLGKYGAVSTEVAKGMACGVRKLMKTDVGISVTGIAGPTGGTPEKPVGMVVMGVDIKGKIATNTEYYKPPREHIKISAATALLKLLRDNLKGNK